MARTQVLSNLEVIGEMIGALKGIGEGIEEDSYMETVIRQAHGKASTAFNVAAAATASAGHLQHVFEFGVAGITPGQPKFPDPTSPQARLWDHTLTGQGGAMDIGYTFRPATNRNPQPTTASTGVASKYLRRLSRRKHVFWNKAFVMETGQTVEIHPKNGNYLFVPFYGEAPTNPLNRRGYALTRKSVSAVPGKSTKGSFTAFWMRWWGASGAEVMETEMGRQVGVDLEIAEREMAAEVAAEKLKPVETTNVPAAVKRSQRRAKKRYGKR